MKTNSYIIGMDRDSSGMNGPRARNQADLIIYENGMPKFKTSFDMKYNTAYYIGLQLKRFGEQIMDYYKEHVE